MSNDPYATPTADLDNSASAAVIETSPWNAKGRLSVMSFMGQSFLLFIVFMAVAAAFIAIASISGAADISGGIESLDTSNPLLIVFGIIGVVLYIAMLYVTVCMTIKRLHDRNHSGWWSLALFIGLVIPIVNIIAILAMIYVYLFPGQKRGNRFGGQRITKGWEKVLGILYMLFIVASIVLGGFAAMSALGGL